MPDRAWSLSLRLKSGASQGGHTQKRPFQQLSPDRALWEALDQNVLAAVCIRRGRTATDIGSPRHADSEESARTGPALDATIKILRRRTGALRASRAPTALQTSSAR